jgi:hypothetical protein
MNPYVFLGWGFGFTAIGACMVGAAWLTVFGPHLPAGVW